MRLQRLSSPGVASSSCLRPLALLWFLFTATASSDAPPRDEALTDEQRLLNVLRVNYDPAVRPVFDARQSVVIHLGITLTQIIDVDEKNQVLTTNVWLDQEWVDQKLQWNASDFANITILRIPCDLIWLPDIVLYNSVENHNKGYMKSLAMVEHNGKVFWPPIVRMRSSCKMDITYFPFDDQICNLKLGSWAYDGLQVDVTNRTVNIDLSNYVDNGEWQLVDTKIVRNVKYYQCCPEPFPDVVFYLHIRRRILYYLLNVIIPCMLLSSLSLTGFLLPPDSGEKVTLGLTVLLAFSVFMLLVAENMPPTSEYVPLVGIYLTVIMAMSALSVALSVFVLNCHHRGAMLHRPHPIVRFVALAIARMMCMTLRYLNKGPYRRCASNNLTSPCASQPPSVFDHTTSSSYLENGLHELNSPTDNEEEGNDQHHQHQQQQHVIHPHYQHHNHHNHNNQSCLSHHNNIQQHRQNVIDLGLNGLVGDWSRPADSTAPCTANSQHTGNGSGVGGTPRACAGRTEREILLYLRAVLEAHERGKLERVAVCEWQEVARVMDKLFFWIFVVVTSVSTVVLLVISPMTKNVSVHEQ